MQLQTSGEGPAAHCAAQLGRVRTGRVPGAREDVVRDHNRRRRRADAEQQLGSPSTGCCFQGPRHHYQTQHLAGGDAGGGLERTHDGRSQHFGVVIVV